ncbi:hypothetical protein C8J56DRAFT_806225 [Mycena floridula]|nr:hypothetical protein C8J56DRAFT_806225 [Mycena floridula]
MPHEFDSTLAPQFDPEDDEDYDYTPESDTDHESDDLHDSDSESPDSTEANPPAPDNFPIDFIHAKTDRLRAASADQMESKVLKVLETMTELNINLPLFLDTLSWGDEACIKNRHIQFSRRLLMHSKELPDILQHWWKPPKNSARRAKAGRHTMEAFAAECMDSVLDKELAGLANWFKSPSGNDTKVETLTDEDFDMMIARVRRDAPRLWQCIRKLAWTASQEKRNTSKDPNKVSNDSEYDFSA